MVLLHITMLLVYIAALQVLLNSVHASPYWQLYPGGSTTALHVAAAAGWYDGLSIMLHFTRLAGGLPAEYLPIGASALGCKSVYYHS
jgi:hypothetical protein